MGIVTVTAKKLTTLPAHDPEYENMVANQGAVTVSQSGENITITGSLGDLIAFPSSVAAQGTHKWIALDLATNLDSIVGATWNGAALTQADVEEAASVGLRAGHIIFWTKADVIVSTPAQIIIGATEREPAAFTVSFIDA